MSWCDRSIMAGRGVAKGKPGREHAVSEAEQGSNPTVRLGDMVDPQHMIGASVAKSIVKAHRS